MLNVGGVGRIGGGVRRGGGGGAGPDLFAFAFYNEAGNTTVTSFDALRVSINGGAWQTLAAAGLTVSQASNGELQVSGFTGSETSVRYHIEHEQPGEPFNIEGTVSGIYSRAVTGAFPANTSLPGIPVAATIFDAPVEATA